MMTEPTAFLSVMVNKESSFTAMPDVLRKCNFGSPEQRPVACWIAFQISPDSIRFRLTRRNCFIEVIEYFGNQSVLTRKLGITPLAVHRWVSFNHLPVLRAIQIERITDERYGWRASFT